MAAVCTGSTASKRPYYTWKPPSTLRDRGGLRQGRAERNYMSGNIRPRHFISFFLWWPLSVTLISPARLAPVPTLPVPTWTPAGPLHRFAPSSLHPHLHSPLTAADWLSCQRPYYTKPPVELAEVSFSLSLALCKANQWHLTEAGTGIFHLTLEKLALFLLDFGHERRRQLFDSLGSETWELFFQDSASYG